MTATDIASVVTVSGGYPVHPVAEMFPIITGPEFVAFVEDVRVNGQMEPVVLDREGSLIDGRNRMRACIELGIEPTTRVYDGDDVTAFIVSHNIHRRHLTDSQRAMIAARLASRGPGMRTEILKNQMTRTSHLILSPSPSRDEAATLLNVSRAQVQKGKVVIRDGLPALQDLVAEGHAPVTTAARVATELSFPDQQEYVEKVRSGADPVKAAPPDKGQVATRERRAEREAKEPPKPVGAKHLDVLTSVNNTLRVWCENNLTFTKLDQSVTAEKAAQLEGDLSLAIKRLNAIRRLLITRKESTP